MRKYYEEIGLEPSYTDEHLYNESEVLDPRAQEEKSESSLEKLVERLLD